MSNNKPWGLDPMDPYQQEINARKGKARIDRGPTPSEVMRQIEETRRQKRLAAFIGLLVLAMVIVAAIYFLRPTR